jgi:hypothetical protein
VQPGHTCGVEESGPGDVESRAGNIEDGDVVEATSEEFVDQC